MTSRLLALWFNACKSDFCHGVFGSFFLIEIHSHLSTGHKYTIESHSFCFLFVYFNSSAKRISRNCQLAFHLLPQHSSFTSFFFDVSLSNSLQTSLLAFVFLRFSVFSFTLNPFHDWDQPGQRFLFAGILPGIKDLVSPNSLSLPLSCSLSAFI